MRKATYIHCGFTLTEVMAALVILGVILTSSVLICNNAMETTIDLRSRGQAFEVARENMEMLLAQKEVRQMSDYGVSPYFPDIEYEMAVEPFYEPITNQMWIQAMSSASYMDKNQERQTIKLTNWVTSLTKKQIQQIVEQMKMDNEYMQAMIEQFEDLSPEELYKRMEDYAYGGDNVMATYLGELIAWHHPTSVQATKIIEVVPNFTPPPPDQPPTPPEIINPSRNIVIGTSPNQGPTEPGGPGTGAGPDDGSTTNPKTPDTKFVWEYSDAELVQRGYSQSQIQLVKQIRKMFGL